MLLLNRVVSNQREKKRRRHARYGLIASPQQKKVLLREDDRSQSVERHLPEEIWYHIHSLVPLRDSVRAASVSRTFLSSWRCHPKLSFTKFTLGLKGRMSDIAKSFTSTVDHILKNHSGAGVKKLKLEIYDHYNVNTCLLNSWLQKAITPGIEKITLRLDTKHYEEYSFPCSMLVDDCGNSIRCLSLTSCAFRPTVGFDSLRNLRKLYLRAVHITGDEFGFLISNSFALEQLELCECLELICLKIPSSLERLSCLKVIFCGMLQMIECAAPNLSTIEYFGEPVQLLLGESSQVKNLHVESSYEANFVRYGITMLPSIVPYLETLTITSLGENVNTPMAVYKFLHLKYLKIYLVGDYESKFPAYDYLSLASFLDACPVLETLILGVKLSKKMEHESVSGDHIQLRQIPGHKHDRLKKVQINGFCSAKSMVELTCHILENSTALESLTVDTVFNAKANGIITRCSAQKNGQCRPLHKNMILDAHKALRAFKTFILGRVPSTVKLNVGEPCNRCHAINVKWQ